jgi:hypothetical protein
VGTEITMRLQRTFSYVPVTNEPVDGYLLLGTALVVAALAGLLTGIVALPICGILALAAVVAVQLSGRAAPEEPGAAGATVDTIP